MSGFLNYEHMKTMLRKSVVQLQGLGGKLRIGSSSGGTAFLWRDRKNNPQENCSGWIKDPESEKADCCKRAALNSHTADMIGPSLHTRTSRAKKVHTLCRKSNAFPI